MAGDWIKMRADLFTHPKVVRIASALKADTLRTVGGLMSVWCLFDAHSEDGHLDGYSPEVLDAHLRWDGFASAMMAVGWLEHDEGCGLNLPRFDAHNGQSSKRRAMDTERKREVRKVSASEADKNRTREEKRREDTSSLRSEVEPPRKRSAPTAIAKPADVDEQTWTDWLALRKAKRAPVTETVLAEAQREAVKADMPLGDFLRIWCARGSQGLQADWLKPHERPAPIRQAMSFAQQDELARRRRWEEMTGRQWPTDQSPTEFIDVDMQGIA